MRLHLSTLMLLSVVCSAVNTSAQAQQVPAVVLRDTGTSFLPENIRPVELSTPSVVLTAIPDAQKVVLRIQRRGSAPRDVLLPQEFVQVDAIYKVEDGKAVLLGMANGSVAEAVIVDLKMATILDVVWCYKPVVSPDGRYLAFVKFYPPHFVEGIEDLIVIYDLRLGATKNRPRGVPISDRVNVGEILFPPNTTNVENNNVRKSAMAQQVIGRLFFSPNSNLLVAAILTDGKTNLLWARRRGGSFFVNLRPISSGELCPDTQAAACRVFLDKVSFATHRFEARFSGLVNTVPNPSIMVAVP